MLITCLYLFNIGSRCIFGFNAFLIGGVIGLGWWFLYKFFIWGLVLFSFRARNMRFLTMELYII